MSLHDEELGLEIEREVEDDGNALLRLVGELDLRSAPHLRAAIVEVLGDRPAVGEPHLVVDLQGLSYADSAGLSMLVAAHKRLANDGGELLLRSPGPNVARLLEVSGLDTVLRIERSPEGDAPGDTGGEGAESAGEPSESAGD